MTFNSISFFLFLPVVYLLFCLTSDKLRWLVLLLASYVFYASFKAPYLLVVLLLVTGISYVCGLRIAAVQGEVLRKRWLWVGCSGCVFILVLLKYFPFIEDNIGRTFGISSVFSSSIISIGVSYFTFQAISYLVDIYLEIEEPEHNFGHFALYMAFFPKLLQGPIERAADLLPQLKQPYSFDYNAMRSGMLLFVWGLFKKVVVADRLALYSDQIYNNVGDYAGIPLIIGTYAYALQIYFDFSAYTNMAIGTGRMFGLKLSENFNSPYLATSIAEFWRRWHISFSRWILDYIFKPLQMRWRDWGAMGTATALIITFFVSGLWHGASWGFVIWGLLHGIYLAISTYYRPYQKKLHKWLRLEKTQVLSMLQIIITFNLVSFSWIFFRANSLSDAWYVCTHIFDFVGNLSLAKKIGAYAFIKTNILMGNGRDNFVISIFMLMLITIVCKYKHIRILDKPIYVRWCMYYILTITILYYGAFNNAPRFLYVQF